VITARRLELSSCFSDAAPVTEMAEIPENDAVAMVRA
jgi:hypothetical protein